MHAHSGVEKGMKKGGKPIEIMGMMVGRIDTDNENTVLVTDVSVCTARAHPVACAVVGATRRLPVRDRVAVCRVVRGARA